MICDHATAADFTRWEEFANRMDSYSLRYTIDDCNKAADALRGWNPAREGYYRDQAMTYGMELTRRNRDLPAALRHRLELSHS